MDLGLTGKVAMVTGASRGLGRAMAHALADEGMYLSVCARTQRTLTEAVAALTQTGSVPRPAMGLVGDVPSPRTRKGGWMKPSGDSAESTCSSTMRARRGRGRSRKSPSRRGRSNSISNLFAPVRLARLCAPHMEKRGGGSIINIGSIYGRESGGPLTYNASKAALHSFTKMLAREYAPKNIRVNTIAPGSILTARRKLGAALSRQSSLREGFHQP